MHNDIRSKTGEIVVKVAGWLETMLALVVLVALAISCLPTLLELPKLFTTGSDGFHDFLGVVLNLVIGVEFIEMLTRHNPGSALEVLLFAIVRHMLVGHGAAADNLLSVGAIAAIFLIRKFAFSSSFEEEEEGSPAKTAGEHAAPHP